MTISGVKGEQVDPGTACGSEQADLELEGVAQAPLGPPR